MQFSLHPIKTSRECFRILVMNERESLVIVWLLKPDLSIPFCSDLTSRQRVPPSSPPPPSPQPLVPLSPKIQLVFLHTDCKYKRGIWCYNNITPVEKLLYSPYQLVR